MFRFSSRRAARSAHVIPSRARGEEEVRGKKQHRHDMNKKAFQYVRVFPALVMDAIHVAILLVVGIFDLAFEDFGLVEEL